MTCPGSFLSSCGEKHLDPKSGWDLDPDKLGCTMSCRGDINQPKFFMCFFLDFGPRLPTFATDP